MDSLAIRLSRRRVVQGAGVASLALLAGCGRLPWQAPPPAKPRQIGYLGEGSAEVTQNTGGYRQLESFRRGLQERGWLEGQNIAITHRLAGFEARSLAEAAQELVQLPAEVIVVAGNGAIRAAMQATSTIPLVMGNAAAPVETGLVAGLARPGGNVTGVSNLGPQTIGKQLELLKDTVPGLRHLAVLAPVSPAAPLQLKETQAAVELLGLHARYYELRRDEDIDEALEAARREGAEALYLLGAPLMSTNLPRVAEYALQRHLPAMYIRREFPEHGGLMSYGVNFDVLLHRAAYYVDRILKGTPPSDLPIEQPMRFELVLNLSTARAIGLTIPYHIMLQVTEVIE